LLLAIYRIEIINLPFAMAEDTILPEIRILRFSTALRVLLRPQGCMLAILDHNEIPYVLLEKEACCGMPKLEQGDLASVEERRTSTSRTWQSWRRRDMRSSRPFLRVP
jgi:hypothetical protein